jgi:acetyl-CoA carboxylase alpha subunit
MTLSQSQGEAIAYNLREMFGLRVPVISVVIGEGGSGGALAIGCANKNLIMENSVYYVASPEACAAILWKSRSASNQVGPSFPALQKGAKHSLWQFQFVTGSSDMQ